MAVVQTNLFEKEQAVRIVVLSNPIFDHLKIQKVVTDYEILPVVEQDVRFVDVQRTIATVVTFGQTAVEIVLENAMDIKALVKVVLTFNTNHPWYTEVAIQVVKKLHDSKAVQANEKVDQMVVVLGKLV